MLAAHFEWDVAYLRTATAGARENLRTGLIWNLTMQDKSVQEGLQKMGFTAQAEAVEETSKID